MNESKICGSRVDSKLSRYYQKYVISNMSNKDRHQTPLFCLLLSNIVGSTYHRWTEAQQQLPSTGCLTAYTN